VASIPRRTCSANATYFARSEAQTKEHPLKLTRILTLILFALGLLSALPPAAAQDGPVETLRVPSGGWWGHPSPFGYQRGPGYMRASLVFDTLVWRDASGQTIPWLATDWALSDDQLTWTFTLREGVRWDDGQPLTADDVVYSIQYYLDHPGTAWYMAQTDQIDSVAALGTNQVAITLKQPFAPFLQTTAEALLIFPRHIWEGVEDVRAYTAPEAFVGSGPYQLVEYSEAEGAYLFEANPDFFLGAPYVRRIEFVPTGDNLLALLNGDIDAFDQFGGVTDEMLAPFLRAPYEVRTAPGEFGLILYFNLEADSPLRDVRVRQAIAHAVDRQAMVERVLFGFGEVGSMGYLPPANPYYNPDVADYPYDLDRARALLAEAGYDGTPITLTYSTDWIMASPRVVEIIVAGLEAAGITVEPQVMDQASVDAAGAEGRYQMMIGGEGGLGGDPDLLRRLFASTSGLTGFTRVRGYHNAEFDALAEAQLALTDPAARRALVDQMQAILAEDVPVLPLYTSARVVVFNADVFDNWYFTPGGWGGGIPMPYNKHQFVTGVPEGLEIRGRSG